MQYSIVAGLSVSGDDQTEELLLLLVHGRRGRFIDRGFSGPVRVPALLQAVHGEYHDISQMFIQTYLYQSDHRDNTGTDLIISGLVKNRVDLFLRISLFAVTSKKPEGSRRLLLSVN
jgi:hypothetical protein